MKWKKKENGKENGNGRGRKSNQAKKGGEGMEEVREWRTRRIWCVHCVLYLFESLHSHLFKIFGSLY